MPRKQHNLDEVIRSLSKKYDVKIIGNTVYLLTGKNKIHDLGNRSHGKIDFLTRHQGYDKLYTETYPNTRN